ncbi:hypothetical protein CRUP_019651 [Coryphaenoides rupestris]|nr:hypothetical protein CRUP_019651 [Coryphaenoides rupestris]
MVPDDKVTFLASRRPCLCIPDILHSKQRTEADGQGDVLVGSESALLGDTADRLVGRAAAGVSRGRRGVVVGGGFLEQAQPVAGPRPVVPQKHPLDPGRPEVDRPEPQAGHGTPLGTFFLTIPHCFKASSSL